MVFNIYEIIKTWLEKTEPEHLAKKTEPEPLQLYYK